MKKLNKQKKKVGWKNLERIFIPFPKGCNKDRLGDIACPHRKLNK